MTTSEQAALLAKHRAIEDDGSVHAALYAGDCVECDSPLPCDVHRMAELKDAEIAELRLDAERMRDTQKDFGSLDDVLRAITRRYPDDPYASYLTDRLINGINRRAVSEAVERIVEALDWQIVIWASAVADESTTMNARIAAQVKWDTYGTAIALLRSRDWSKEEG